MINIGQNIRLLKSELPSGVTLVAVSKTNPPESIMQAYHAGQRVFGENRVQELLAKQPLLPADIEWHLIGHLQTNKVKYIIPVVSLIHSVDSLKLLQEINKEAGKQQRTVNCLLQIHIADEESKFGFSDDEVVSLLQNNPPHLFPNICFKGVMGIATYTENTEQVRSEFRHLKEIYYQLKNRFFPSDQGFCEISMGMSGDYPVAIQEGATIIRVGSRIFGER